MNGAEAILMSYQANLADVPTDRVDRGELAYAAAVYALPPNERDAAGGLAADLWPFDAPPKLVSPLAPHAHRRAELVTAGCFLAAEIDRLTRLIGDGAARLEAGDQ